jgi:hypothetical protein
MPKIKSIGCLNWQPIWFAAGSLSSTRKALRQRQARVDPGRLPCAQEARITISKLDRGSEGQG